MAIIIPVPKPKTSQERKLQTNISYEYGCENLQQNASKPNLAHEK